jgi:hypothetical protein
MRTQKAVVTFCLLSALFLGVSSGAVLVIKTVQKYSGACDTLNGFPGVLQQAGFMPKGDCQVSPRHPRECLEHTCRTKAGKLGRCESVRVGHDHDRDDFICVCKPNHVSK